MAQTKKSVRGTENRLVQELSALGPLPRMTKEARSPLVTTKIS